MTTSSNQQPVDQLAALERAAIDHESKLCEVEPGCDTRQAAHSRTAVAGVQLLRFVHTYRYPGAAVAAQCNVVVATAADQVVVLLIERADNPGRSVTNAFERIAGEIHAAILPQVPAGNIRWIEHYGRGLLTDGPTFDRVTLDYAVRPDGSAVFCNPGWSRMRLIPGDPATASVGAH